MCTTSMDKFEELWKLDNYSGVSKKAHHIFRGCQKSNHKWRIRARIEPNQILFTIHLIEFGNNHGCYPARDVPAKCNVDILDKAARIVYEGNTECDSPSLFTLDERTEWRGSVNLVTSETFFMQLASGDLIIRVTFHPAKRPDILLLYELMGESTEVREKFYANSLVADFKYMKDSSTASTFSDVTIVTDQGRFEAHKFILAARSTVFKATFQTPMVESRGNEIQCPGYDDKIVEAMLQHIYTGTTPLVAEEPQDMLRISNFYNLHTLKLECEVDLCRRMTIDNAAHLMILADLYNATRLKLEVVKFISANRLEVIKTPGFRTFNPNYPNLLEELYKSI